MKKILLFLFVLAVFFAAFQIFFRHPPMPTSSNNPTPTPQNEIPILSLPTGNVDIYKGFWMPCLFQEDDCQSLSDASLLKEVGANIVSFGPTIKLNAQGKAKLTVSEDFLEERLLELARRYYPAGIRIHLVIIPFYEPEFQEKSAGETPPIPSQIVSQSGFLNEYSALVQKMAILAEKYKVEIFSPMNEPDYLLGDQIATAWSQQILPIVKQYFSGIVLYKAAFATQPNHNFLFKGYNAIGIDLSPGNASPTLTDYEKTLTATIDRALALAKRDKVPRVFFTQFGAWGPAAKWSEEDKMLAHRLVFEKGQGKINGFLAFDPPSVLDRGLKDTPALAEIKTWFKEKLP